MILADTNILIDYYRDRNSELPKKIDSMPIAICGVVKSEVLHGARTNEEIDDMLASFMTFDLLHTDEYDFEGVGFILKTLREVGFTLPFADVMIAFCAMKYNVPLWTRDTHFRMIQGIYPELEFYHPKD
ncbi:MAG: PIN domain-containing protein [Treponema sp.]|nr:PIN domain-containing protein [Treponema sp.]